MRFASLFLALLPSLALCQEGLRCRRENDVVLCEFQVPADGKAKLELSHCLEGDDICVEAQVTVKANGADSVEGDSNKETTINDIVIAGQTYREPFSQYGAAIAQSLSDRPTVAKSWQYGDWLIQFATTIRGEQSSPTLNIVRAIAILELSAKLFTTLAQMGYGDAKVSMANSYMTMAETYIFDLYNPQYGEALDYFELSNKLFKEALDENKFPIGITRADVELNWADTLVRIAVILVEQEMGNEQDQFEMDLNNMDMNNFDMKIFDMNNLMGAGGQLSESTKRAEELLTQAVASLRDQLAHATNPTHALQRRTRLANALQNLASISMMVSPDLEKIYVLLEEAVTHYMAALKDLDESNPERGNAIGGVAESLYSLSDGYLQAGKYEQAKARYRDTMNWYKKYNLATPVVQDAQIMDADGTLEATEHALEEYTAMLYGGGEIQIPNDHTRPGDPLYQADELYEADLHATLGALRMTRNEMHLAINHFANAIELYARNPGSERILADTKLNLAMSYFKQGDYELSIEANDEALDIYERVTKEGKNPLMDGLEDMMTQHGIDPETLKAGAAEGDPANRMIDLGAYQASILNDTAKDEL